MSAPAPAEAQAGPIRGALAHWQVRRLCAHLEANLARNVTLAEMADLLGISRHHLCRAFRASVGVPPHQWVLGRRMEKAKEALRLSDAPLAQVAADIGYRPSQFSTSFRKILGVTPREYRRRWASDGGQKSPRAASAADSRLSKGGEEPPRRPIMSSQEKQKEK